MTPEEFRLSLLMEQFGTPTPEYRPIRLDPEVEARRARQDAEVEQWEARRKTEMRAASQRLAERRRYLGRAG